VVVAQVVGGTSWSIATTIGITRDNRHVPTIIASRRDDAETKTLGLSHGFHAATPPHAHAKNGCRSAASPPPALLVRCDDSVARRAVRALPGRTH
jgi:hypothetical protein